MPRCLLDSEVECLNFCYFHPKAEKLDKAIGGEVIVKSKEPVGNALDEAIRRSRNAKLMDNSGLNSRICERVLRGEIKLIGNG